MTLCRWGMAVACALSLGGVLVGCSSEATSEELTDVYQKREQDAKKLGAADIKTEQSD